MPSTPLTNPTLKKMKSKKCKTHLLLASIHTVWSGKSTTPEHKIPLTGWNPVSHYRKVVINRITSYRKTPQGKKNLVTIINLMYLEIFCFAKLLIFIYLILE